MQREALLELPLRNDVANDEQCSGREMWLIITEEEGHKHAMGSSQMLVTTGSTERCTLKMR